MRKLYVTSIASLLAGLTGVAAQAAGNNNYDKERSGGMAGTVDQAASNAKSKMGAAMSDDAKKVAQQDLAPHSLMMETSLKGALTELQGLRAELKVNEDQKLAPSSSFIQHFRMLGKEINDDVKMVKTHEKELQGSVQKHPDIAKTQDYRSIIPSLNELYSLNSSWQAKANTNDYWKNPQAVKGDLDRIESRLNAALDKTKGFNSSQLDLSSVG